MSVENQATIENDRVDINFGYEPGGVDSFQQYLNEKAKQLADQELRGEDVSQDQEPHTKDLDDPEPSPNLPPPDLTHDAGPDFKPETFAQTEFGNDYEVTAETSQRIETGDYVDSAGNWWRQENGVWLKANESENPETAANAQSIVAEIFAKGHAIRTVEGNAVSKTVEADENSKKVQQEQIRYVTVYHLENGRLIMNMWSQKVNQELQSSDAKEENPSLYIDNDEDDPPLTNKLPEQAEPLVIAMWQNEQAEAWTEAEVNEDVETIEPQVKSIFSLAPIRSISIERQPIINHTEVRIFPLVGSKETLRNAAPQLQKIDSFLSIPSLVGKSPGPTPGAVLERQPIYIAQSSQEKTNNVKIKTHPGPTHREANGVSSEPLYMPTKADVPEALTLSSVIKPQAESSQTNKNLKTALVTEAQERQVGDIMEDRPKPVPAEPIIPSQGVIEQIPSVYIDDPGVDITKNMGEHTQLQSAEMNVKVLVKTDEPASKTAFTEYENTQIGEEKIEVGHKNGNTSREVIVEKTLEGTKREIVETTIDQQTDQILGDIEEIQEIEQIVGQQKQTTELEVRDTEEGEVIKEEVEQLNNLTKVTITERTEEIEEKTYERVNEIFEKTEKEKVELKQEVIEIQEITKQMKPVVLKTEQKVEDKAVTKPAHQSKVGPNNVRVTKPQVVKNIEEVSGKSNFEASIEKPAISLDVSSSRKEAVSVKPAANVISINRSSINRELLPRFGVSRVSIPVEIDETLEQDGIKLITPGVGLELAA